MIAFAIITILVGLAFTTARELGTRTAAQNAAHDFGAALSQARALAQSRGHDVWLIIYPTLARSNAPTGGSGGYFIYSDPELTFNVSDSSTALKYSAFSPTQTSGTAGPGRLVSSRYLDDYTGDSVKFALPSTAVAFTQPFLNLNPVNNVCTFCSAAPGGGTRGAIVFDANGAARFVDGAGTSSSARMASVVLANPDPNLKQRYLFGVAAGTGYVGTQVP